MIGTVLIVGGGTGGHISPGIALYEQFRETGVRAFFLAGRNDARFSSLRDVAQDELFLYDAPPLSRNILRLLVFPLRFGAAVMRVRRIIRKNGVGAVIGMGGYVSAPALVAAWSCGVPLYLCEQNTVPGRVTSFFLKRAAAVFTTFEETAEYVKEEYRAKLMTLGNPIRKKVFTELDRDAARRHFNMKHCRQVLLAIGGSQGAQTINELLLGLRRKYPDEFLSLGVIWSTGDLNYLHYKEEIQSAGAQGSVYLSPFIDEVGIAYRACDMAISRAGSGVMVELAAMGVPSILIPFPFAAMDHQDKNADSFVAAGASVKIANKDAVPEKVGPALFEMLHNPTQMQRMASKALEAAKPHAARDIAQAIRQGMQK